MRYSDTSTEANAPGKCTTVEGSKTTAVVTLPDDADVTTWKRVWARVRCEALSMLCRMGTVVSECVHHACFVGCSCIVTSSSRSEVDARNAAVVFDPEPPALGAIVTSKTINGSDALGFTSYITRTVSVDLSAVETTGSWTLTSLMWTLSANEDPTFDGAYLFPLVSETVEPGSTTFRKRVTTQRPQYAYVIPDAVCHAQCLGARALLRLLSCWRWCCASLRCAIACLHRITLRSCSWQPHPATRLRL